MAKAATGLSDGTMWPEPCRWSSTISNKWEAVPHHNNKHKADWDEALPWQWWRKCCQNLWQSLRPADHLHHHKTMDVSVPPPERDSQVSPPWHSKSYLWTANTWNHTWQIQPKTNNLVVKCFLSCFLASFLAAEAWVKVSGFDLRWPSHSGFCGFIAVLPQLDSFYDD